jgi:hypothetical protein
VADLPEKHQLLLVAHAGLGPVHERGQLGRGRRAWGRGRGGRGGGGARAPPPACCPPTQRRQRQRRQQQRGSSSSSSSSGAAAAAAGAGAAPSTFFVGTVPTKSCHPHLRLDLCDVAADGGRHGVAVLVELAGARGGGGAGRCC